MKFLSALMLSLLVSFAVALIVAAFIMLAWNVGICAMFVTAPKMSYGVAVLIALVIAAIKFNITCKFE